MLAVSNLVTAYWHLPPTNGVEVGRCGPPHRLDGELFSLDMGGLIGVMPLENL